MKTSVITFIFTFLVTICWFTTSFSQATFEWATHIGGAASGHDGVQSMDQDKEGNTYITGPFMWTTQFSPENPLFSVTDVTNQNNHYDSYIAKLDANGVFLWAYQIQNDAVGSNTAESIKADKNGNVYICGSFVGTADFDPSEAVQSRTSGTGPGMNAFLLKLDKDGNYQWVKTWESTHTSAANALAIDTNGNIWTTGYFMGTMNLDPNNSAPTLTTANPTPGKDLFICKLDKDGNYLWSNFAVTGGKYVLGHSITVDKSNNILVSGEFEGTVDFNFGTGTDVHTSQYVVYSDMFALKLDNTGNFIWCKTVGANTPEIGHTIVTDTKNNVFIAVNIDHYGSTTDIDMDPGIAVHNLPFKGGSEALLLKLDSAGNYLWAANTAESVGGNEHLYDIKTDNCGRVYALGYFQGETDFDPGVGTVNLQSDISGSWNTFISELDSSGTFVWAGKLGQSLGSSANESWEAGLYVDKIGNIFSGGSCGAQNDDFDPDPTKTFEFTSKNGAGTEAFVLKLKGVCCQSPTSLVTPSDNLTFCAGDSITLDAGTGFVSYLWSPNNETTQTINVKAQGTYSVTVSNGICPATSPNVTTVVNALPTAQITGKNSLCAGDSTVLTSSTVAAVYTWNTGSVNDSIQIKPTAKKDYVLTITDSNGCKDSDSISIDVIPLETKTLAPKTILEGASTILTASSGTGYLWSPALGLSCSDCASPIATPTIETEYCVVISSETACKLTECTKINIKLDCGQLFVPTGFSPNGDEINDELEVKINAECISEFEFLIFDRWGEKVFESRKVTDSWDGKFNGKELDNAAFVYYLKLKLKDTPTPIVKKGNVSIIK